ncbi:MAG: hypothetical protein PF542_02105 [Nanoarchaeota archaeon]|jgi:hypothetical protein|nr:hypothetical protein [Nanoarchaeota archaeon]
MKKLIFVLIVLLIIICPVLAKDISVYQGQYFIGTEFQQGTFQFDFNVYDAREGGDLIYTYSEDITTGQWGSWEVELEGVSEAANNSFRDYFMEVVVEGVSQLPRRRITQFDFARVDIPETFKKTLVVEGGLFSNYIEAVNMTAAYFSGDGSQLKNLPFPEIDDSNYNVNSSVYWSGLVDVSQISASKINNDLGWVNGNVSNLINFYNRAEIDALYYSRGNVDNMIGEIPKINISSYYTKDEIENLLLSKISVPSSSTNSGVQVVDSWLTNLGSSLDFNEIRLNRTIDSRLPIVDLSPYYTKLEVDSLAPDLSVYYLKGEVDSLVNEIPKINVSLYYTKPEVESLYYSRDNVDSLISAIPETNLSSYYTKSDMESLLASKVSISSGLSVSGVQVGDNWLISSGASLDLNENKLNRTIDSRLPVVDLSPYYTKLEVDSLIPDLSVYYLKGEVDSLVRSVPQVNLSTYYTKSEIENLLSSKVSVPVSISTSEVQVGDSWLIPSSGSLNFNENKLASFVSSQIPTLENLSNYYNKQEVDGMIYNPGVINLDSYYTSAEVDSLIASQPIVSTQGTSFVGSSDNIFYAYLLGSVPISDSWTQIPWNQEVRRDSSYVFESGDSAIMVRDEGWYEISFECTATATSKSYIDWRMLVNSAEEYGARATSYHNGKKEGVSSASISLIKELTVGDEISFEGKGSSPGASLVSNGCRLLISKRGVSATEVASEGLISDVLALKPTEKPVTAEVGTIYFDKDSLKLMLYDGVSWKTIMLSESIPVVESVVAAEVVNVPAVEIPEVPVVEAPVESPVETQAVETPTTEPSAPSEVVNVTEVPSSSGGKNDTTEIPTEVSTAEEPIVETPVTGEVVSAPETLVPEVVAEVPAEVIKEEAPKEVCKDVCDEECTTVDVCEDVCEDVEECEDVCKTNKGGVEKCSQKCKVKQECNEECTAVEECEDICEEVCGPEQLFDIRMDLDDTSVDKGSELTAIVTYESFGSIPTKVYLTFEVFDSYGQPLFIKKDTIVVDVEEVRFYDFSELDLPDGNYEFVFTTLYNSDVEDKFKQNFIVKSPSAFVRVLRWIGLKK